MKIKSTRWVWIGIALLLLLTLTAAKGPDYPWQGKWWSIDPFDDSLQSVVFLGGSRFKYVDRGASICGKDEYGLPIYRADAMAQGTISGYTFTGTAALRCLAGPPYIWGEHTFVWTYDPATNTISDGFSDYTRTKP